MEGWIKLHRKMVEWEWYNDNNTKIVFLHLLLTANHTDKKWQGKIIQRGQKITSIQHLADETNLTPKQVRIALDKLKRTSEVATKGTSQYTLITIEKYNDYQDYNKEEDKQEDKQEGKRRANGGQTKGNKQE